VGESSAAYLTSATSIHILRLLIAGGSPYNLRTALTFLEMRTMKKIGQRLGREVKMASTPLY
jgi:hypothetical protein